MHYFLLSIFILCVPFLHCADNLKRTLEENETIVAPVAKQQRGEQQYREKIDFTFENGNNFCVYNEVSRILRNQCNCVINDLSLDFGNPRELIIPIPYTSNSDLPSYVLQGLNNGSAIPKLEKVVNHPQFTNDQKTLALTELKNFFHFIGGFDPLNQYIDMNLIILDGRKIDFKNLVAVAEKKIKEQNVPNQNHVNRLLQEELTKQFNILFASGHERNFIVGKKNLYIQLMNTQHILVWSASMYLKSIDVNAQCKNNGAQLSFIEYQLNRLTKLYDFLGIMQLHHAKIIPVGTGYTVMVTTDKGTKPFDEYYTQYSIANLTNRNLRGYSKLIAFPKEITHIYIKELKPQDRLTNIESIVDKLLE